MKSNADAYLSARSLEAEFREVFLQRKRRKTTVWIHQIAAALLSFFTGQQTISIRKKVDAKGEAQWIIYHSINDVRIVCSTEQEVRIWLERADNR